MTPPKLGTPWQESLPDQLPRHVKRNIRPGDGGCWVWTRSTSPDGYGWASLDNKTYQAHRLVYTLIRGTPPNGMMLDHLCRNRICVNPDHLEPVTAKENLLRSPITPAGQKRCLKCGGEFSIVGKAKPQRRCLRCAEEHRRMTRERKKAAA